MKQQNSSYTEKDSDKHKARILSVIKNRKSMSHNIAIKSRFLTCDECNGKVVKKKVPFKHLGVDLGRFEAEVCTKCGETVFSAKEVGRIEQISKEKGVWGLSSKTKVGVSGNSLDIRIDKKIAEFLKLKKGTEVTVQPEGKDKLAIYI